MPIGPLSFLPAAVRRVWSGIKLGVRLGLETPRILGSVGRAAGTVFRAQTERVIAAERAAQARSETVLGRASSTPPDPRNIPEGLTRMRRQYAWRTRVRYIDPRTGASRERFITVSTDELISEADALERSRGMMFADYGIDEELLTDLSVADVRKASSRTRL